MCEPALWQKKYAEIAPSKYYIKLTRACCTSNTSCTQVLHTEQPSTIRQPFSFPEITGGQQKKKKKKKKQCSKIHQLKLQLPKFYREEGREELLRVKRRKNSSHHVVKKVHIFFPTDTSPGCSNSSS
jgi:hypothetical protein